jgi:hypothetical protein
MEKEIKQLSKGYYEYPQISNFVSVKNYIFISQGDKKYVLLRFFNESDFAVNDIKLTLTQYDMQGKLIGKEKISLNNLKFSSGTTYASSKAIHISNKCVDFKVTFDEVVSGDYVYRVTNNNVVVHYEPKIDQTNDIEGADSSYLTFDGNSSRRSNTKIKTKGTLFFVVLMLVLLIIFNVLHLLVTFLDPLDSKEENTKEKYTHTERAVLLENSSFDQEKYFE